MLKRAYLTVLLAATAAALSGCTTVAHWMFPCPLQASSTRLTRDTPEEAVAFLVDAFEARRTGEIYTSLHPDYVRENGEFSQSDFALAYEHYEADFAADARNMAAADREFKPLAGGEVLVELTNSDTGAFIPMVLSNRPKVRVVTTNQFVPPLEGAVDMHALVRLSNGRLALPPEFALTSIEGVSAKQAAAIKPNELVRVEFHDDWVVRRIDVERARGIGFLDKIKEYVAK